MRRGPVAILEPQQDVSRGAAPARRGGVVGVEALSFDLYEFQYNENAHCPVVAAQDICYRCARLIAVDLSQNAVSDSQIAADTKILLSYMRVVLFCPSNRELEEFF